MEVPVKAEGGGKWHLNMTFAKWPGQRSICIYQGSADY